MCDGTNGTPNLTDRFVVGAGSAYNVADIGGSANAIVVSHTHTITDTGHTHTESYFSATGGGYGLTGGPNDFQATKQTGSNVTGITIGSTGSSGTNANLPPYYALAYIMKA